VLLVLAALALGALTARADTPPHQPAPVQLQR
jgi:hypothetical protein